MTARGLILSAPASGQGKTTVALALMAAARARGLAVRSCKVGPDFIDPGHHRAVTGAPARTLDGWMLGRERSAAAYARAAAGAELVVVEGMMGLFDGLSGSSDAGSTAEIARWLDLPVVLVVDAGAMARSVAALVGGFRDFDPAVRVAGVVFDRVAGDGHRAFLVEALASAGAPPCLGALPLDPALALPERHLGLVTAPERTLDAGVLAAAAERHLDVDALLALAAPAAPAAGAALDTAPARADGGAGRPVIAVARDAAFSFYYPENLELLAAAGADVVEFSPLAGAALPAGTAGVYLGGGYPEVHAAALAANGALLADLRRLAAAGGLVYAECGGLMLLGRTLADAAGTAHAMAGVFSYRTVLGAGLTIGYREVETVAGFLPRLAARGHEFHQGALAGEPGGDGPYLARDPVSGATRREGFTRGRTLASWVHLHFASAPALAPALVAAARAGLAARAGSGERRA